VGCGIVDAASRLKPGRRLAAGSLVQRTASGGGIEPVIE
jgi:hypothetical protein